MEAWNADDVRARMNFSLRCAFAHGTGAIRTHLDWVQKPSGLSWSVFREMREEWRGKIELQAAALFPIETAIDDEEQFLKVIETVAAHEGVLGGVACLDEPPGPKLEAALDRVFDAAIANGFDLDLHVDETLRTTAFSLELIANAAIRHCFRGKLVVGHCCSLALVSEETRDRVVALLADAKISVVSLPMCNMYLQDRTSGRTPRLRGVAPVHELDAGGVRIMIGSDNVQDPFYPYGDLDMLEVYREATRILHLDHSNRPWLRALGVTAAEIMGLTACREICPGQDADFVLTSARTIPELLSRPQSDRMVLVAGRAINSAPPDYRELDPAASRDIT
jgi:cytosine deaminase